MRATHNFSWLLYFCAHPFSLVTLMAPSFYRNKSSEAANQRRRSTEGEDTQKLSWRSQLRKSTQLQPRGAEEAVNLRLRQQNGGVRRGGEKGGEITLRCLASKET